MQPTKQCPQCGKPVAPDRTYCLNCGVTLGIRCPSCRLVLPVGSQACAGCGHSFVRKKKARSLPLWRWMKAHAKPLVAGALTLLFILTLVMAALPSVLLSVRAQGREPLIEHSLSGYTLIGAFLSAGQEELTALLAMPELSDEATLLRVLLFAEGFCWLVLLVAATLCLCLVLPNYKRFGKNTARRLYAPLGVTLGASAVLFGLSAVVDHLLAGATALPAEGGKPLGISVITSSPYPLILLLVTAAVFLLHVLLHLGRFRREETLQRVTTEELALGYLLGVPFRALTRLVRRHRATGGKKSRGRDEPTFTVTPRFTSYLILLGVSLVFTQALLSKVSNIFFWFVLLLPAVLLGFMLWAKHALAVTMLSDTVTTEKNTPYTYQFRIDNRSPLALPFIDARISIPQSNSVRCTERTVRLSMAPLSGYCMKNTVRFRFRGTYDIGVRCFYVYDPFRLFRVRVDVDSFSTVYVLPRRLTTDDAPAQAIADSTVRTVRSPLVVDKLEVSDIRDYQNGDPLKNIHWKLSSKSETFIVKDYNTGTANQTVIFCDLTPHFPDEPPVALSDEGEATNVAAESRGRRPRRQSRRAARRAAARAAQDMRAKNKRIKENRDTHAISDEALSTRLKERAAAAGSMERRARKGKAVPVSPPPVADTAMLDAPDVHELTVPSFYEDMNEYLADGVVELTIASVLAELRQGHEVLLLWFDRRADTGVFAYPLRGADEFETIYHLFATAPLCDAEKQVTALTAMLTEMDNAKQLFVVSTLDGQMLTDLTSLPCVSDAANFGSTEVLLYNPEERFAHPRERTAYLEGCREELAASGLSLRFGDLRIRQATPTNTTPEGGNA